MVDRCTRMVLAKGRKPIVREGFPKEGTENFSREILVMPFQSIYQNAIELTDTGFEVVNTPWQPLYIVPSRPKYWEPDYLYRRKVNKWLYEEAEHDEDQPMIVEKRKWYSVRSFVCGKADTIGNGGSDRRARRGSRCRAPLE